jgi:class 3 adenylate cyclase
MALSNEANDALFFLQNGKKPNAAIIKGIQSIASEKGGDIETCANALLRIIGGYGADEAQVNAVKEAATAAEFDEQITDMLDTYSNGEDASPKQFDRSQMAPIMLTLFEIERADLVDPSSRIGDAVVEVEGEEAESCGDTMIGVLDSTGFQASIGIATGWALFATDVAIWVLPKSADFGIAIVTFLVFLLFLTEFLGNIILGRDYGSDATNLFFILDFVGTASLIPEFLVLFDVIIESPDNVVLARVARAARIGARLSRLTKVFRVKGGESKFTAMLKEKGIDPDEEGEGEGDAAEDVSSQVGAKVADGISKKIVVLVIVLLVFVPMFEFIEPQGGVKQSKEEAMHMLYSLKTSADDHAWKSPNLGTCNMNTDANGRRQGGTPTIPYEGYEDVDTTAAAVPEQTTPRNWCATSAENSDGVTTAMTDFDKNVMAEFLTLSGDRVVYFTWDRDSGVIIEDEMAVTFGASKGGTGTFFFWEERIEELRPDEISKYGDTVKEHVLAEGEHKSLEVKHRYGGMEIWVDSKDKAQDAAALSILYMWWVIVIFATGSLVFMADIETLVIEPVEGMTKAMSMIASSLIDLGGSTDNNNEANYIETSVLKIVSLLNVSFGDAGRRVIDRSMTETGELTGEAGHKVEGVYGMSDIRQFTAVTEALSQDIVLFVNEFGNVCHSSCEATGGRPNKNVGDAFLCVWIEGRSASDANLCDNALACYRQTIQKIRASSNLQTLIARREIKQRFPDAEQPFGRYIPSMGFGLHYGSSIEGLIGTSLKMDASYLGGDVDLADKLEENTKVYNTPILMTESFFNRLSEQAQATCRLVDRVSHQLASEPFKLYAANVASTDGCYFDRDLEEDVVLEDPEESGEGSLVASGKSNADAMMEEGDQSAATEVVSGDGPMTATQYTALVDDWNDQFESGVEAYIKGDWGPALSILKECMESRPWDGPGQKLISFMEEENGKAPKSWQGFAELS